MKTTLKMLSAAALLAAMAIVPASAQEPIGSGGAKGFYFAAAQMLESQLGFPLQYQAKVTGGTPENIELVLSNPRAIGFVQGDVFADWSAKYPDKAGKIETVAFNGVNECVFVAVKSAKPVSMGTLTRYATSVTYFTPKNSGSLGSLKLFQGLQKDGIGKSKVNEVTGENGQDDVIAALEQAAKTPGGAAVWVMIANPDNARFKKAQELGMMLIPFGGSSMESVKIGDKSVYSVQPTPIETKVMVPSSSGPATEKKEKLTTTCTTMMGITGKPEANPSDAEYQKGLVAELRKLDPKALLPKDPALTQFVAWAKSATAVSGSKLKDWYKQIETELTN